MSTRLSSARRSRISISKPIDLQATWIDTPLDPMLAISDDQGLYLLGFAGQCGLNRAIKKLCSRKKATITLGTSKPIASITKELKAYFLGELTQFSTPLHLVGTPFQKSVWQALKNISYGQTKSYLEQAESMQYKKAVRAVANANGANPFAIVIPCHRVISSDGSLGGYGGGLPRKQWLLAHETKIDTLSATEGRECDGSIQM